MKKKLIIAISVIIVVLVTIVSLSFTLFTVQNVEIDMRTSSSIEISSDEILKSAQISKGRNIFFLDKEQMIQNIEKSCPTLEVINIETKFPSKLIFHLAERTPFYAISCDEGYLYLDKDLKVLQKSNNFEDLVLIDGKLNLDIGDFAELTALKNLYDAFLVNGRTPAQALATFNKLEYFESENEVYHSTEIGIKLTMISGREVYLHNCTYELENKLAKFYAVLGNIFQLSDKLSSEVLTNSEIHINNFIATSEGGQTCYFYLVYNGEKVTI